jgi:predicted molibdopterin-dependent oxidoreductase YjgC
MVEFTLDGEPVSVPEGATILAALRAHGMDVPTLCYGDTITPKNACRVCMVEVDGSRALVPACSRPVETGMGVHTDTDRIRHARRMVLEFLASSTDLSTTPNVDAWLAEYGADPSRYGTTAASADTATPALTSSPREPAHDVIIDNDLYVRDYGKCILCYQCVDACGEQWQQTFAIGIAGRGFDAHVSTEYAVELPDSACVYCGNCIAVCPTGALMNKSEFDHRAAGTWDEAAQSTTDTICSFCGVGCTLTLHVQDNEIVKVTSPHDHDVTSGNLCIKGRFGWQHVQPPTAR